MTRPRAIFFGTPAFAVPCLEVTHALCDVVRVVSQPDKPQGRGLTLAPTPIKARALALGLEIDQPTKVRTPEFAEGLRALGADLAVVVAYGRILTRAVLDAPRLGCVNVHGSLLPRWRGAAPIQWAVASGDAESGVCLMRMDEGMDTGPELARRSTPIGAHETAGELAERLAALGAELLRDELPRFLRGELEAAPQPTEGVTFAPILEKEHGRIDWTQSAAQVDARVRGMSPWPGAFTFLDGKRCKVLRAKVHDVDADPGAPPGTFAGRAPLVVACGRGHLRVEQLQLEGKKPLEDTPFLAGRAGRGGVFEHRGEGETT